MSNAPSPTHPLAAPVHLDREPSSDSHIEDGMALCLSGGGYRAMVFHLGSLIRLNELGVLRRLKRISSVSGGSITAGALGAKWKSLSFDQNSVATNLMETVIRPVRDLAAVTVDEGAILGGVLLPGISINDKVIAAYRRHLFGDATLQDLPGDGEGPRFVINATNVQSGALWRFSRPFMGDYLVGRVANPTLSLAIAVAASSAFPPILSPAPLHLRHQDFTLDPKAPLKEPPFTTDIFLSDGGVYDNLGLETAWKRYRTLLVSDAGQKMAPEKAPHHDWARHALRINDIIDNQVRSLRKRQLIAALISKAEHDGAYWGIRTDFSNYPQAPSPGNLQCPLNRTTELAATPTRLKALDEAWQNRLINWGYAVTAAAMESHVPNVKSQPAQFPFPGGV